MSVGSKDLGLFPGDGGGSAFRVSLGQEEAGGGFSMPWEKMAEFLTAPCGRFPAVLNGLFDERRKHLILIRKR